MIHETTLRIYSELEISYGGKGNLISGKREISTEPIVIRVTAAEEVMQEGQEMATEEVQEDLAMVVEVGRETEAAMEVEMARGVGIVAAVIMTKVKQT
jgi:putative aminopeptidase FrvX